MALGDLDGVEMDRRLSRASPGVGGMFLSCGFLLSLSSGDEDELQRLGHRISGYFINASLAEVVLRFRLLACVYAGKARFLIMYLMPLMPSLLAPFDDANIRQLQFSFITFILTILNRKPVALSRLYDLTLEMCHAVVLECDTFGPDMNIVGRTQNTLTSVLYNQP
jgi:hypothetical protein